MKRSILGLLLLTSTLAAQPVSAPAGLPLDQAIRLAIQNNLTRRLAEAASEEARAQAIQAAAALLPRITGSVAQSRTFKVNLAANGFPSNNFFPSLIGPFNTFDARLQLVQNLLDVSALYRFKAIQETERAAKLQEDLASEQVASAAAIAYIETLRAQQSVQAAQADLELAQRLSKLAHNQHSAGISTGVDVARADTSVAQSNLRLIRAQLAARSALIRLKRVIGVPLSGLVTLTDPLQFAPVDVRDEEQAVTKAQQNRIELRIAEDAVTASRYAVDAARAQYLPALKAMADYGYSGRVPSDTARTGSIGGRLDVPIFAGGLTRGQVREQTGKALEASSRLSDIRVQIEEDARLGLQTLVAEVEEVKTADLQLQLAQRELQMAQDRFAAGVGDNIQLITAQASLADAREAQITALASYLDARINLALALGEMKAFKL